MTGSKMWDFTIEEESLNLPRLTLLVGSSARPGTGCHISDKGQG